MPETKPITMQTSMRRLSSAVSQAGRVAGKRGFRWGLEGRFRDYPKAVE